MAQNYINNGDHLEVTLGGTHAAGAGILVGDTFGVALNGGVNGTKVQVKITGVFLLPKATGTGISQGAQVYWDDTAKKIAATSNTGANKLAGIAVEAELSAATTIKVKLVG